MKSNRAFTLIELLVVMAIIALLIGLLLPALNKARMQAKALKDATQIRGIHQGWLVFAREFNGILPTPGLIDRLPENGLETPGRGPEDKLANDHGKLHSAVVMNNYYSPEMCIGPTEPSGRFVVKDDYNYDAYDVTPEVDQYWDPTFKLIKPSGGNVSYATMPIGGTRKLKRWRDTISSDFALLGNRGVKDGNHITPATYNKSITLQIHGGRKEWDGNICYGDGRVVFTKTFFPDGLDYQLNGVTLPDNLFKNNMASQASMNGDDCWLVMCKGLLGNQTIQSPFNDWD